ncbi:MAG: 5'-methylthioadenosine/S-adenosylhomocysteine nucleosidase [Verrucomicrobiota bacterium]
MKRTFLLVIFLLNVILNADDVPRTAIVAAFPGEMESIRRVLDGETISKTVTINGVDFELGEAYGVPVVFFMTRVSMTNAAMHTQLLLSHFNIERILFAGIAGGIDPKLKKGDVSVPSDWIHHIKSSFYNPKSNGAESYIFPSWRDAPEFANFGMIHPERVEVLRDGLDEPEDRIKFPADLALSKLAENAITGNEIINATGKAADISFGGVGVSGPIFMDNREYREFLFETWDAEVLDMESSAIAHVAWSNGVPCLIIRSISDLAGGQEGHNEIYEFANLAQDNAAQVLDAVMRALSKE